MAYKDINDLKAYRKKYRENNKEKIKFWQDQWKKENVEKLREYRRKYNKEYFKTEKGKKILLESNRRQRIVNYEKIYAREKLHYATRTNKLKREPCVKCGDCKSEGHHPDYSKPLEVIWLCKSCHTKIHRNE